MLKRKKAAPSEQAMKPLSERIKNVILCEDIRDEVGNKKSLMGVMAGDILVAEFPATIKVAFFIEYTPDASDRDRVRLEFRLLQNDTELAKGRFEAPVRTPQPSVFVLPTGLMGFEQPASLRMLVMREGEPEHEILNKKIELAKSTS